MKKGIFTVIFGLILVILTLSSIFSIYDLWKRKEILVEREKVLDKLHMENLSLKTSLEESQTDGFIEREARDKLGLVKPGDTVLLLQNPPAATGTPDLKKEAVKPSWKTWWKLFW